MIRIFCVCQVALMTGFTPYRRTTKVSNLGTGMALKTGNGCVGAYQREPGSVMQHNLAFGNPIAFVMALNTLIAKLAAVNVFMTTDAAALLKNSDGTAIIVAPQALCGPVRAMQWGPGFTRMVEYKIGAKFVPAFAFMTQ
jgi:hypothetical protein